MPSRTDVISFGEILWDIFETRPRGREPIAREFRRELGGAPANVATGLARLGVRAAVVGGVGQDRFGDALLGHLEADGVESRFVIRFPNRTGLTFVTRDAHGEPAFLFYRHETADVALTRAHIEPEMGRARWVIVGTSTLMTRPLAGATAAFLRVAKRAGASVVVDLNVRAHMWANAETMRSAIARLAGHASLIKASTADLAALAGGEGDRLAPRECLACFVVDHARQGACDGARRPRRGERGGSPSSLRGRDRSGRRVPRRESRRLARSQGLPGTVGWADPGVWQSAIEVGHRLAAKAIARPGSVRGLVGLAGVRAAIERIRAKTEADVLRARGSKG